VARAVEDRAGEHRATTDEPTSGLATPAGEGKLAVMTVAVYRAAALAR
jgi:hypothetical protein